MKKSKALFLRGLLMAAVLLLLVWLPWISSLNKDEATLAISRQDLALTCILASLGVVLLVLLQGLLQWRRYKMDQRNKIYRP